ncbi:MAG: ribose-5-phosphate isomerase RpiA [Pusillimonas sp.]|nr:ribose-5-phosphate isomerase RpiA [Pusillimonas sp.]
MLTQQQLKENVAAAAVNYVSSYLKPDVIVGIGSGSTADLFIDRLAQHKHRFKGTVSSSERTTKRLQSHGIAVFDLNDINHVPVYVDGADEIDAGLHMIKGGGGALTREKIVASVADQFVCIVDESKCVEYLGAFPLPIEVIPMAREAVARDMVALGGRPQLREGFTTDNGGEILDVAGLRITDPKKMEAHINNIPGVVTCGLFAIQGASVALVSTQNGIEQRKPASS